MLLDFDLYSFSVLALVQLVLATVLVLSPVREIGNRFGWMGSRMTEVVVNGLAAVVVTAVSCLVTHLLWGSPIARLESPAVLLVTVSIVVIAVQPDRSLVGQLFYAAFGSASLAFGSWAAYLAIIAPRTPLETVTASLVLVLDVAAFFVWLSSVNYHSDVLTRAKRGRPLPVADPTYQPFVSLHMPAYNEPPELLIESIKALEQMDYPNFEIIVIDNNTADPAVWGPVEEYCRDRPRVTFIHVAPWPGYKAGACNLALREYTDPRAELIGLVDADDIVQSHFLRETASYFSDPNVGFLQTCESNRDYEDSSYYTACVNSYQGFYLSVMSSRNERDTVPFVGTMGLFRRSALESVGGWNEWCICEDTEASLRVLKEGWSGLYIPRCFGRGVVPPSWAGMLTQRHRWCFGAMQILRLHWRSLMPWDRSPDNHLTGAQRRDYLMASLSWFRDLLMLAFSVLLLAVSCLLAVGSDFAVAPLNGSHSLFPMVLIVVVAVSMLFTLRHFTALSHRRAALSLVISLGVTLVIARGCIEGVARRDGVFLRTSKSGGGGILTALKLTRWETGLAIAMYVAVAALIRLEHPPWLLVFLVAMQATVYLCGPVAAIWNHRALRARREGVRTAAVARRQRGGIRTPRGVVAILSALVLAGLASAFVSPSLSLVRASTAASGGAWPPSLLGSARTEVYLELGSTASAAGRVYQPITLVHLARVPGGAGRVDLAFSTSSAVLLGEVMRAAATEDEIDYVSIAFRQPGPDGRSVTRLVDTFSTAVITSVAQPEPAQGKASPGTVTLLLPAATGMTEMPARQQASRLFAPASAGTGTRAFVSLGQGLPSYLVTAISLSRAAPGTPLNLTFSTKAPPLLQRILEAQRATAGIPALTLSLRHGTAGSPVLHHFTRVRVNSFAENLSTPFSGTASLAVPSRQEGR